MTATPELAAIGTTHDAPSARDIEDLVREHMPMVGHLVRELLNRVPGHVHSDDLSSAGFAALLGAARTFDVTRGIPFHRFAAVRIRGALLDELRDSDWASRSVRSRARRHDAAAQELTATLGRTPTAQELADATVSFTAASGASVAISKIDAAIKTVSTTRADLGAIQNRFEHTINNLNVAIENVTASESRIRDTDMAAEMTNFTRSQILTQAGTAMLAQANSAPQAVLQLLRG